HAFGQRALAEAFVDLLDHLSQFVRSGGSMRGIAAWKQRSLRLTQNPHPHRNVADAHTIVDQRFPFTRSVPASDVVGACFQFERGGYAIVGLEFVVARLLAVLV